MSDSVAKGFEVWQKHGNHVKYERNLRIFHYNRDYPELSSTTPGSDFAKESGMKIRKRTQIWKAIAFLHVRCFPAIQLDCETKITKSKREKMFQKLDYNQIY